MKTKLGVGLNLVIAGTLLALMFLTGASRISFAAGNPNRIKGANLFSKEELNLFKRIAASDNPRDPDSGPPFIYSAQYQWTPDREGKIMRFDQDQISDYPNGYRVVYYPGNDTVLFSWDAGQADRGCCTYVVLERLIIKTVTAGGLSIQYEKVYHNGVPVYYKVAPTGLPAGDAAPKIKSTDFVGRWILKPGIALNFKANGDLGDDSGPAQGSWSFNPYNKEIYINVMPPAIRTLKLLALTGKYLKVSEAGKEAVYRKY